jgi:hypothetical protein
MVLHAKTNRLVDLQPLTPDILAALPEVKAGEVTHIGNHPSGANSTS